MTATVRAKTNRKIVTKNAAGTPNGFLIPILNVHEKFVSDERWPLQIYCTVANPGEVKGPHLHMKRWGLFTCIKGDIKIVVQVDGQYHEYFSGENHDFATVQVPAGVPNALVNIGDCDAYILNMPSPAWHPDDPDDCDAEFPDYDFFA
jgi:dTDP-4-dehydrorhamnose 3,5-epimerase